jgi:hypothetical protein
VNWLLVLDDVNATDPENMRPLLQPLLHLRGGKVIVITSSLDDLVHSDILPPHITAVEVPRLSIEDSRALFAHYGYGAETDAIARLLQYPSICGNASAIVQICRLCDERMHPLTRLLDRNQVTLKFFGIIPA